MLFFEDLIQTGTNDRDYMFGGLAGESNTINGNGGNDAIFGDNSQFWNASNAANTAATSIQIDNSNFWSLFENPAITDSTTIPHTTLFVEGAPAGGEFFFAVTVGASERLIVDVDFANFDTVLSIFAPDGTVLDDSDDDASDIGSQNSQASNGTGRDSYIDYTNTGPERLIFIRLGEFQSGENAQNSGAFEDGDSAIVYVSVSNHAATRTVADSNDTLNGGDGDDFVTGGTGDDTISGGTGDDQLFGGSGVDTITFADFVSGDMLTGVTINLGLQGEAQDTNEGMDTYSGFENAIGSAFEDSIFGDAGNNRIEGGEGNDFMTGNGGTDTVLGGAGDDTIYFFGDWGVNNTLDGGEGTDTFEVESDTVTQTFDLTSETLSNFEVIHIDGNLGGRMFINEAQIQGLLSATPGEGLQSFSASAHAGNTAFISTTLSGDSFLDLSGLTYTGFTESSDAHRIVGTSQTDAVSLGQGIVYSVSMGGGDDTLTVNESSNSLLDGNEGLDTLVINDPTDNMFGVIVNLRNETLQYRVDPNGDLSDDTTRILNFEIVNGTQKDDEIVSHDLAGVVFEAHGGNGSDRLIAGQSQDVLEGGEGDDTLEVNIGELAANEIYNGGEGNDTLRIFSAVDASFVDFREEGLIVTGIENIVLQGVNDGMGSSASFTTVFRTDQVVGLETLSLVNRTEATSTFVSIQSADNTDQMVDLSGLTLTGFTNADDYIEIVGAGGNDTLIGTAMADRISGGDGMDTLTGGDGADTLNGGEGNDTLTGGLGVDIVNGGAGDDTLRVTYELLRNADGNVTGVNGDIPFIGGETYDGGEGSDTLELVNLSPGDPSSYNFTSSTVQNIETVRFTGGLVENLLTSARFTQAQAQSFTEIIGTSTASERIRVDLAGDTTFDASALSLTDIDGVFLVGDDGDQIMIGASDVRNSFSIGLGTDQVTGGTQNDFMSITKGQISAGDSINLGGGTDTLRMFHSTFIGGDAELTDFRGVTLMGIENFQFGDVNNATDSMVGGSAAFNSSQFAMDALGGVVDFLDFNNGTNFANTISIFADTDVIDLSGFTFTDWNQDTDRVEVIGDDDGNTITGATVATLLQGGDGVDLLTGLAGNDILMGGLGDDTLNGGDGVDEANFQDSATAITLNLNTQGVAQDTGEGMDTLINIEDAAGSDMNDMIQGNGSNNYIVGNGGDDMIIAGNAVALTDVEGQVYRAFRAVFDRDPDLGGFNAFRQEIRLGNLTQELMIAEFVGSDEFLATYGTLDNGAFLDQLFLNVFDRPADAGGREAFLAALEGGRSRASVVTEFANSDEFIRLTTVESSAFGINMTFDPVEGQVFRIFQAVFNRLPDVGGYRNFVNEIQNGIKSLEDAVVEFIGSPEFVATYGDLDNAAFVEALYTNVLPGNMDQVGRAAFTAALQNGDQTRAQVVQTFSESQEFRVRVDPAVADFVNSINLMGSSDSDTIQGDAGNDMLFGGRGADIFYYDVNNDGADVILDFVAGDSGGDVLGLLFSEAFDTFAEVMAVTTQVGANTLIDMGNGNTITLRNVDMSELNAADFLFDVPGPMIQEPLEDTSLLNANITPDMSVMSFDNPYDSDGYWDMYL